MYGGEGTFGRALETVRSQFNVIQSRTQLLLTLCTITLTITGFSGPRIAESSLLARVALGIGLALTLAATVVLLCTLRIRWLTTFIAGGPADSLAMAIAYRNDKTRWYTLELVLLLLGLAAYVGAVLAFLAAGARPA